MPKRWKLLARFLFDPSLDVIFDVVVVVKNEMNMCCEFDWEKEDKQERTRQQKGKRSGKSRQRERKRETHKGMISRVLRRNKLVAFHIFCLIAFLRSSLDVKEIPAGRMSLE